VIKSVRHWRLENERDILKRFQSRSSVFRPLIDEIEDPIDPPAIVLKHLDDDLWNADAVKRLTGREIKQVARVVLEGLRVLHEDGYVHTGMLFYLLKKVSSVSEMTLLQISNRIMYW
jgi:hypothetical protein